MQTKRKFTEELQNRIKNGKITIPDNVRVIAVDPVSKNTKAPFDYTINNHAPALDYGNPMFERIWRSYERSGSKYAK